MSAGLPPNQTASTGEAARVPIDLLRRYDRPGPRYTSYPTAVEFHEGFDERAYRERLADAAAAPSAALSLYIHLPFCSERCTFCGCMVVITQKPEVSAKYLRLPASRAGNAGVGARQPPSSAAIPLGRRNADDLSVKQMADLHEQVVRHFTLDRARRLQSRSIRA